MFLVGILALRLSHSQHLLVWDPRDAAAALRVPLTEKTCPMTTLKLETSAFGVKPIDSSLIAVYGENACLLLRLRGNLVRTAAQSRVSLCKELQQLDPLPGCQDLYPLAPPHVLFLMRDSIVKYNIANRTVIWKQPYAYFVSDMS